jgi:hypothetical protein
MHTEYFMINQRTHRHIVKTIGKQFPDLQRIPPLALIKKPVNPINRAALVIASKQKEVLWVFDFVGE